MDALCQIPFEMIFGHNSKHASLFYIIKTYRIHKGSQLLSSNSFMKLVKMIFNKRLDYIVQSNKKLANNNEIDNNNIGKLMMISYFFKISKLVLTMVFLSYFMGLGWYMICLKSEIENPVDEHHGFMTTFDINSRSNYENTIIFTYWAFTTLSTVGFGDYYPTGNLERVICAFLLLFGVTTFSYILGSYISIINSI